jgi:hypothetical protein
MFFYSSMGNFATANVRYKEKNYLCANRIIKKRGINMKTNIVIICSLSCFVLLVVLKDACKKGRIS